MGLVTYLEKPPSGVVAAEVVFPFVDEFRPIYFILYSGAFLAFYFNQFFQLYLQKETAF